MQLCDVFLSLGEDSFCQLIKSVSIGKLRTYKLHDQIKARARLVKLNAEHLRKAAPRLWSRLVGREEDVAQDLAQAILVSHLDMIIAVLNFTGVPHEEGFFSKEIDASQYLTEGWRERVWEEFRERYARPALLFYINHLAWELTKADQCFLPAA